jgi:L-amino acid N-acyltransferase
LTSSGFNLSTRGATISDLPGMLEIYNDAILTLAATFDLQPQSLDQRRVWFEEHNHAHPIIVLEADGRVVVYASLSPFRDKPGYAQSVESSVYVHKDFRGRGYGTVAMEAIIDKAKELGYHTIVAAIVPPNEASVRLHRKLGFEYVGRFAEVGYKFGTWQHVDFYQLTLTERLIRPSR